jgi:hypothetical protein
MVSYKKVAKKNKKEFMKKITFLILGQFLAMMLVANAQVMTGNSAGASAGVSGSGYTSSASPSTIIQSPMPIVPPPLDSGFIQFNNLTVESVSATNPPAEILASNPSVFPMMSTTNGAILQPSPSSGTCYKFGSQDSISGSAISCPMPSATTTSGAASDNTATSTIYPSPYPIRYQPYRIEVDVSTHLMLRDRTTASLNDFASGDQINVFGYYNSDNSIQAYLVRDLSKPARDEFIQLNNVDLISISTSSTPTQLVVAQSEGYPCYGFDTNGNTKMPIVCPMGVISSQNSAVQNIQPPTALVPNWTLMRKYIVNVDANTIILDSNRMKLTLIDLQVGDELNIYGDTNNNGQTLNADIVRDLSIPATPTTYNGKVTQVNADGSFVIQTNNGQMITVQNPIQVGTTVQLTGLLDRLKNVLSQVTNIFLGNMTIYNAPSPPPTAH